ncbi:MAG TPA: 3D domain-containing protein [bacterium]|nr:3D domain-containing protein [bacterium]
MSRLSAPLNERLGLFLAAALLGLSPLPLGWMLLAQGRAASEARVDAIEVRPLEPPPKINLGPHLPKGCVLLLKRPKAGPWSVLVEQGQAGERLVKVVKALKPGTAAWVIRGSAPPLDIGWPALGVARRRLELETTAYDPGPGDNSRAWVGVTRTGSRARFGIVAVDPSVIPLGTRVYIEGYGPGLAADIGGAIKGRRMDLCFNTSSEARDWGRRRSRVWIVDPAPKADRAALRLALAGL